MGKKLYVGNLPFSVTDQVLMDTFSQVGTVESVKIITNPMNGQSKGFGFVEMATEEEAQTAIKQLHNTQYEGRTLTVDEARPPAARDNRGGSSRGGSRDRDSRSGGGSRGGFGRDRRV